MCKVNKKSGFHSRDSAPNKIFPKIIKKIGKNVAFAKGFAPIKTYKQTF